MRATEAAKIKAISAGRGSLAAGIGPGAAGIAVSGAGAERTTSSSPTRMSTIEDSSVHSAGKVDLDASEHASIEAVDRQRLVCRGGRPLRRLGASIGVAIARNYIGWEPDHPASGTHTTGGNPASLLNGDTVRIEPGRCRTTYTNTSASTTLTGPRPATQTRTPNWLTRLDYGDTSKLGAIQPRQNAAETSGVHPRLDVDATGSANARRGGRPIDQRDRICRLGGGFGRHCGCFALSGAGAASDNRDRHPAEATSKATRTAGNQGGECQRRCRRHIGHPSPSPERSRWRWRQSAQSVCRCRSAWASPTTSR